MKLWWRGVANDGSAALGRSIRRSSVDCLQSFFKSICDGVSVFISNFRSTQFPPIYLLRFIESTCRMPTCRPN